MSKIVLFGFLLISIVANGQFSKGDKVLGGTFSFYSQNAPSSQNGGLTNNVRTLSITPTIGFLVNENSAFGGKLGYASSYQEISNYSPAVLEFDSKSFSAGVFGIRYFKISDKFLFSLIGGFNFSRGFETDVTFDQVTGQLTENKTQNYGLTTSIRPNFIFFPSPKWGFEASIGSISHTFSRNLSNDDKTNFFSLNYGSISFGVAFYFRKSNDN